jgi:hypothetical protein
MLFLSPYRAVLRTPYACGAFVASLAGRLCYGIVSLSLILTLTAGGRGYGFAGFVMALHPTSYRYSGDASPSTPGGMATIYKDLIARDDRNRQVIADVTTALRQGRNCLVLTNWTSHLDAIASALRALGHDPVILKGGTGARERAAALARLTPQPGGLPLLAVATGPYAGEGFDCPPLDTLFLAAPVASKGRLLQYAGRILRPYEGKATAEVHEPPRVLRTREFAVILRGGLHCSALVHDLLRGPVPEC